MRSEQRRWNHNTHYYDLVLDAVPPRAHTALDAGTGDGLLAARLAQRIPDVTGIDSDVDIIVRARSAGPAAISWVVGDVLTAALPKNHYDLVAAVATVHHFPDLAVGLARLAQLTAVGGRLVVIGCARSSTLSDRAFDAVGVAQHQILSRTRGFWQHNAPVEMRLPHKYSEVGEIAASVLPGMTFRRLPLWRYVVIWGKES